MDHFLLNPVAPTQEGQRSSTWEGLLACLRPEGGAVGHRSWPDAWMFDQPDSLLHGGWVARGSQKGLGVYEASRGWDWAQSWAEDPGFKTYGMVRETLARSTGQSSRTRPLKQHCFFLGFTLEPFCSIDSQILKYVLLEYNQSMFDGQVRVATQSLRWKGMSYL